MPCLSYTRDGSRGGGDNHWQRCNTSGGAGSSPLGHRAQLVAHHTRVQAPLCASEPEEPVRKSNQPDTVCAWATLATLLVAWRARSRLPRGAPRRGDERSASRAALPHGAGSVSPARKTRCRPVHGERDLDALTMRPACLGRAGYTRRAQPSSSGLAHAPRAYTWYA